MPTPITYICSNPDHKASILIDPVGSSLTCGIVGVTSLMNVRIIEGVARCAICNSDIYKQGDLNATNSNL